MVSVLTASLRSACEGLPSGRGGDCEEVVVMVRDRRSLYVGRRSTRSSHV